MERLFVTGFTMFGATGGTNAKYYKDDRPGVGSFHDLDVESRIFASLLSQNGVELDMTPEVEKLVKDVESTSGTPANGSHVPLRKRIAGALGWRLVNMGTRLRRIGESK